MYRSDRGRLPVLINQPPDGLIGRGTAEFLLTDLL
jgi:hypothetical protein